MAPRTTSGSASTVPSGGLPTWVVGARSSTHPGSLRPGPRKAMKATKAKTAQAAGNARGRRPKSASASPPTRSSAGRYAAPAPSDATQVHRGAHRPRRRRGQHDRGDDDDDDEAGDDDEPVGGEPAQAGQGAGQPGLETSGGLLAAQAADGLDGIARGDDGDVELGDGDEPVLGSRTRHPDGLGHGRVAGDGVDELLGERAHHAREDQGTGEPTEDRRAVDGGRQPERAAQPCRRPRRVPRPRGRGRCRGRGVRRRGRRAWRAARRRRGG